MSTEGKADENISENLIQKPYLCSLKRIDFMQLTLEIQSQQELQLILQYLQLLPGVRVLSEPKNKVNPKDVKPSEQIPKKDFSKYWGSIQTGFSVAEIDHTINKMRSEWDRDFS